MKLKPGVTVAQAQAEISAAATQLDAAYPTTNRGRGIQLLPVWQSPFNPMEALLPTLGIALAVVTSVLLIACANVGNLLLVRALARQQEMTIRLSIGAGRARLVRQLLTEGVILALLAAVGNAREFKSGRELAAWLGLVPRQHSSGSSRSSGRSKPATRAEGCQPGSGSPSARWW